MRKHLTPMDTIEKKLEYLIPASRELGLELELFFCDSTEDIHDGGEMVMRRSMGYFDDDLL